jgi:hypothetical protein
MLSPMFASIFLDVGAPFTALTTTHPAASNRHRDSRPLEPAVRRPLPVALPIRQGRPLHEPFFYARLHLQFTKKRLLSC